MVGVLSVGNGALVYPRASRIVGYQQDEEKSWIAVLSCGHRHVVVVAEL